MINKLKRFIDSIENTKLGFGWWIITFSCIILVRNFLEGILEIDKTIGFIDDPYASIMRFFSHYPLFYLSQFFILVILLRLLTKERIEKISKTVIVFWIITWFPPVFDFFFSGGKGENAVYFFTVNEVWNFFINCANPLVSFPKNAPPGIRIEFVLVSLLAIIYVFTKTKKLIKSIAGAILFYLSFTVYAAGFLAILAHIWNAIFPQLPPLNTGTPFEKIYNDSPSLIIRSDQRVSLIFLLVIMVAIFIWYFLYDRNKCLALLKNIRLTRCIHFCGLVLGGILLGYLAERNNLLGVFSNPIDYLACIGLCLAIFFAIQSLIVVNDIFDIESDRISNPNRPLTQGIIPLDEYKTIGLVYFLLMGYFAANISYLSLVITLFFSALYLIYSIPPFRLKRIFPFNMMVIGINSLVAMLLGYALLGGSKTVEKFPKELMILVPLSFSLAANIITIKDVKADKQAGVITLPVLLGEKIGRIIIAFLVLAAYLAVPLILGIPQLWLASILFGILAGFWILRKKWQETPFFISYFIYLAIVFYAIGMSSKYI
ncbi:MAG: UbiA family prenyltransferase [Planctomycetes bacterium]|nr:UbiA family prenyltransferase [Planctomycetota bacterium]